MGLYFICIPLIGAAIAFMVPSERTRPLLLPVVATIHLVLTVIVLVQPSWLLESGAWFVLDPPGRVVLAVVSILYWFCACYGAAYLRNRTDQSNRVFVASYLAALGCLSGVIWSRHLVLMWVSMEATALTTAPLIYFNRNKKSIEATWKYLLIGSVGVALALLGTFFLAYSALQTGHHPDLNMDVLLIQAHHLSVPWLRASFILMLVGYGTKMGLAPMHTWKPDAYGEAPGVVGALFAGGVTSCAFLMIVRLDHLCILAGQGEFAKAMLLTLGLLSMAVAGVFLVGQRDFKRMLAYSSVEHMGILAIGLAVGGIALFGVFLHIAANAFTKGVLFLSAGNLHRAYGSKNIDQVSGAEKFAPWSAWLFMASFLAITGSPPFAPFVSEITILTGAVEQRHPLVAVAFLVFLFIIFVGMGATVLAVFQGKAPKTPPLFKDTFWTLAPVAGLMLVVLILGVYLGGPTTTLLDDAARYVGGS